MQPLHCIWCSGRHYTFGTTYNNVRKVEESYRQNKKNSTWIKSTKHKPSYLTCRSVSSYDTQQGNNIVYSSRENKEHIFVRYDAEVVGHSAYHYHCPERKNSRLFRVKLRKTYWTNVHSLTKFCLLRSFGRTSANDWSQLKTMNIAHAKRMQF